MSITEKDILDLRNLIFKDISIMEQKFNDEAKALKTATTLFRAYLKSNEKESEIEELIAEIKKEVLRVYEIARKAIEEL